MGRASGTFVSAVYVLEGKYAGKSRREKLDRLRQYMEEKGGDTALLSSLEDIAWLMNLRGNDVKHTPVFLAFAKIDREDVRLYAERSAFSETIITELAADGIELRPYMQIYEDLKHLSDGKLMYDPAKVNYALSQCVPKNVQVILSDINEMIPKAIKMRQNLKICVVFILKTVWLSQNLCIGSKQMWEEYLYRK